MVSACDSELDRSRGLDAGADDYIVKPFGIMEFAARIKAILRRTNIDSNMTHMDIENIHINSLKREVSASGRVCSLTYKEYELLKLLMTNAGIVVSREVILDKIWGTDFEGESRTLDMHIKTLRQKLKEEGSLIKTVRNVGYIMSAGVE
jgi:two-component system alkaline phosphatase synthesis response regulator PhoP